MIVYDIDGVFCDFFGEVFVPLVEKRTGKRLPKRTMSWDLEVHGLTTQEVVDTFQDERIIEALLEAPINPKGERLLREMKINDVFVTGRGADDVWGDLATAVQQATKDWLLRNHAHNRVYFVSQDKKDRFIMNGLPSASLVWEDNPRTVLALAEAGVCVMMPIHGYNQHIWHENVVRMENWWECEAKDGHQGLGST